MSNAEARDAYMFVEVPLANGKLIRGKPLPLGAVKRLLLLDELFCKGGNPSETLFPMLEEFERLTGVTEAQILELCPDATFGELYDLVRRFFFWRRTVPTVRPLPTPSPTATPETNGGNSPTPTPIATGVGP